MIYAARCGAKLLEAKAGVAHGEWLEWLGVNTEVNYEKSKRYMRLAKEMPELLDANRTISTILPGTYQALALIAADDETKSIVQEKLDAGESVSERSIIINAMKNPCQWDIPLGVVAVIAQPIMADHGRGSPGSPGSPMRFP